MTLIAIALFGLLFAAVFGAKAAQGVLFGLLVCALVLTAGTERRLDLVEG